ncbi:phosphoinositide phospholipase C 2-like [Olea europaea subsp. europaea]|uniref:Phosphoinositide phospholipase C n=1 Tax=Olea europaea subsp. europaea TaxID=158383 RepID=A0A8S0P7W1_OLEEU|nr:phosphoinositide phospholipase C 2-like [Olea europaea subsp. europaea]
MSKQTYRVCFCFRRRFRLAAAEAPKGIKALFNEYSEKGIMGLDQLRRFLDEVQKEENATLEDAQAILDSLHEFNIFHRKELNIETFFKYLFGDVNPPLNPKLGVHHDMTAPLSHYFIFTGHNSYLTGNQLSSDCSAAPIVHALERGVRVIELDIWPNSRKDNVNVLHGRTLTTPVELIKCLRSIKEHAFSASEYPVVITLEDHLTPDLQAKVAEALCYQFNQTSHISDTANFFSKQNICCCNNIIYYKHAVYEHVAYFKHKHQTCRFLFFFNVDQPTFKISRNKPQSWSLIISISHPKRDLSPWLLESENPIQFCIPNVQYEHEDIAFRKLKILEQGYGRSLWLMHGMFRANGGCGYVKKPEFLLKAGPKNEVFDPKVKFPVLTTLRVTVYMGVGWYYDFHHTHFDTYSPPDFYTKVGIAGVPADTIMKKTKILEDNWIPNWDETFDFPLTVPELAMLRIEVHEYDMSEKDDFAGQTCLPVLELRKGIRAVPLHSRKGEMYDTVKLLMRFEFV